MSDPHPTSGHGGGPSPKQMRALRSLAASRGQTFAYPRTGTAASAEIRRLLRARPTSRRDRLIESHQLQQTATPQDSAAVRPDEITGYGSSARWARHDPEQAS